MKWEHYYPIYRRVIPFHAKRILEIGVRDGDGMKWLAKEFPQAQLVGIDVDLRAAPRGTNWCLIHANQCNLTPEILERIGPIDAVIDDGGHRPYQQAASFKKLWPLLNPGGVYCIEDMHMGQKWLWRLYSTLFGIQPILRRMTRRMSAWNGPQAEGWASPYCVAHYPQLTVIHKGTVYLREA